MPATSPHAIVIGAGPAGLMAAETLAKQGLRVDVYDGKPSAGRKFLMAGKGGMNITHSESSEQFVSRYAERSGVLSPLLQAFGSSDLRQWIHELGIETFVGSSGRVFPTDMKAAPLLRRWLHRLREQGVTLHMRHYWKGWTPNDLLRFETPEGEKHLTADIVILALGGGSWARLGSDGSWTGWLGDKGINIAELRPSNCGFECSWSDLLKQKHAGAPLKSVAMHFTDHNGRDHRQPGECILTEHGIEGGLVYTLSAAIRDDILAQGHADVCIDLLPALSAEKIFSALSKPRGSRTLTHHLQSKLGLKGAKIALLYELTNKTDQHDMTQLAQRIKALPLRLTRPRPMDEAISTAGGVRFEAMDEHLMLRQLPGYFCAGEMLDWEAPTGGYLLTACFATGKAAGEGALAWLRNCHKIRD